VQRRNANANADSDGNRDTDTNANIYAVRNSDTQTYAVTQTSPDAATPPNTSNLLTVPETPPVLGNPINPTTIKPMRSHMKQSTSSMYVAGRFARNCLVGAISSPMPRAAERAVTRGFSIPIGSTIAAVVWSYEFSKFGNLLSSLL
jgi:hypothetical protein